MKRMLISADLEESRAAVVDDDTLVHLEIEPVDRDSVKGNIYRGVVARVEPSLQSAFVDFGSPKQGFLPVGEIHPKIRGDDTDKRTPIQQLLKAGQVILVQVTKDEIGNKGATLTTFISLPGRYLVLMPESDKTGVSRKLSDSARARVKELTDKMKVPDGFGLIVRTAGEQATKLELTKDLVYLNRLWTHIDTGFNTGKGTAALYHERSLAIRFVRDYFKRDVTEIVVDDEDTLAEVTAYLKVLMPRNLSAVERYSGVIPLFARYGIAGQVESVFARQVPMRGGGSIVIDQTEALVSIDVNSGRVKGKDIEETARQTNLEAAREVARQLVLRDLGGLVVIDFIDMRDRKYVREVEAELKSAMKSDKARHKLGKISEFGLMELSRQRLKSSVNKGVFETCEHCSGTGFYRTTPSLAASVMRRIHELVAKGNIAYVVVTLPHEASNYLLNAKRTELANVEREYHVSIEIIGVEGMTAAQVTIEHMQRMPSQSGSEKIREARFLRVTNSLDLVRNKLLKQEEARIDRKLAAAMSGSAVDYADVYNGVIAETADIARETEAADVRREKRHVRDREHRDERPTSAASLQSATVQPTLDQMVPPQPQGFTSWLKGLFRFGDKGDAVEPEPVTVVPAPGLAAPEISAVGGTAPSAAPDLGSSNHAAADGAASDGGPSRRGPQGQRPPREPREAREPRESRDDRGSRGPRADAVDDDGTDESGDDADGRRGRRGGRRRRRRDDDRRPERGPRASVEGEVGDAAIAADASAEAPRTNEADAAAADLDSDDEQASKRRRRRGGGRRSRRRDEDEVATQRDGAGDAEGDAGLAAAQGGSDAPSKAEVADTNARESALTDDAVVAASVTEVAGDGETAADVADPVVDARALAEARLAELRAARGLADPQAAASAGTSTIDASTDASSDEAEPTLAAEPGAPGDVADAPEQAETPEQTEDALAATGAVTREAATEAELSAAGQPPALPTADAEDDAAAAAANGGEEAAVPALEPAPDAPNSSTTNPFVIDMRSPGGNNPSSSGR